MKQNVTFKYLKNKVKDMHWPSWVSLGIDNRDSAPKLTGRWGNHLRRRRKTRAKASTSSSKKSWWRRRRRERRRRRRARKSNKKEESLWKSWSPKRRRRRRKRRRELCSRSEFRILCRFRNQAQRPKRSADGSIRSLFLKFWPKTYHFFTETICF